MARQTFMAYLREHECEISEFHGKALVTRRERVSAFELGQGRRGSIRQETIARVCTHLAIPIPR
ncbi:hypothetical protein [Mucisphaera sp.]|uniref:hypothetical protein n=1 Tax=Mucisphaera sp. TaxID=2913024 RepID=UPI003D0DE4CF